jgi:hypothetical protein
LLADLDEGAARRLAWLVGAILAANAVIGIIEFATDWRLISIDLPENVTDDPRHAAGALFDWRAALARDWRPTALLGHPLTNAGVTGVFVATLCVRDSSWIAPGVRFPLLILQTLALFAFGGRASLVATAIVLAATSVGWLLRFVGGGLRFSLRQSAGVLLIVPFLLAGVGALVEYGYFDRIMDRFSNDFGSAAARSTMFDLFRSFSIEDILLGPDPAVYATQQRLEGLEFGVESFLVGFVLNYGALLTMLLLAGLGAFCAALARVSGRGAGPALFVFFVPALTATSLSSKTTVFGVAVALILLFVRPCHTRDGRPSSNVGGS